MLFRLLHGPVFRITTWGLLSLWLFFGCLELGEQMNIIVEMAEADHEGQDPDQEALSQLASGLKSDAYGLVSPCYATITVAQVRSALSFRTMPVHGSRMGRAHSPPSSLRLHQQVSVYRI